MKYRTHDDVRGEFVTTPEDEADLAAFKEEALAEVRQQRGLAQTDLCDRVSSGEIS